MSDARMDMKAAQWIVGGDVGASSRAIWGHMMGATLKNAAFDYPSDCGDFGRCYRLLKLIPEWRPRVLEMARYGKVWAALAVSWDELERLYEHDAIPAKNQWSDAMYQRMKAIIHPIEDARGDTVRIGNSTMRFGA